MAQSFEKQVIECNDLKKCGEISVKFTSENKEYFLNCEFCDYSFLQIEDFIQHISDDHFSEFSYLNNHPHMGRKRISSLKNVKTYSFENSGAISKFEEDILVSDNELRDFERVEIELDPTEMDTSVEVKEEAFEKDILNEDLGQSSEGAEDTEIRYMFLKSDSEFESETNHEEKPDLQEIKNNGTEGGTPDEYDEKERFILDLIGVYRSLPALWDPKCPDYTDRLIRNLQYETLLEKYKEQYPEANKDDVRQKIYNLRTNFRRESKRLSPSQKPTLYYYNAMSFLIENEKRVHTKHVDKPQETASILGRRTPPPESKLNEDQFIILAKIYRKYPLLWDESDIAYRFSNRRREALISICEEFNEDTGLNLEQDELEREIARLRKASSIEKKEKIRCKRNHTAYTPTCPFYQHITFLEINVSPFECKECGKVIPGACQFKLHLASHDGTLPYTCNICGHGFKLASNLTVHLRRHVQDYTYNCKVCNRPCATSSELKIHMRYHTGEKNYVCDTCGQKFYTASKFNTHNRRHENRPRHRCEICGKGFYVRGRYLEHMSAHGTVRDKICDVCNKGFKNRIQLRQHKRIHDPVKKYLCKICGKRFAQNAGLNGHMKTHGTKLTLKKPAEELESMTDLFFGDNKERLEQA